MDHHDICIIGAGVIGLAVAQKISSHSVGRKKSVVLLEQHGQFGQEISSRNSEVIHAGIYYPENSLKAKLCVDGREQLYHYCKTFQLPFRKTGKLIVAGKNQHHNLERIVRQATANNVNDLQWLCAEQIKRLEPAIKACQGLFSPQSGIIDSHAYMQSLLYQSENAGVIFAPFTSAQEIERHPDGFMVTSLCQDTCYQFSCTQLINAAGLSAQKIASRISDFPDSAIPAQVLVKGSYFNLQGASPFQHLIYPLPEENLKGLGIHVTLDMSGQVRFGPDTEKINAVDYAVDKEKEAAFRQAIAHYFPAINQHTLQPAYSGIRPKLESLNGAADFEIQDGKRFGYEGLVQLFGIESPGLTASLAIADHVASMLFE